MISSRMPSRGPAFRFYVVPQAELGPEAAACWTHWSQALFDALRAHPARTRHRGHAHALIPEVETRFEVSFPLFAQPRLGYARRRPPLCDSWRGENFTDRVAQPAIARLVVEGGGRCAKHVPGRPGQRVVLFPPIACHEAHRVVLGWHHREPCVTRALTSGAEIGIYRRGRDVSFPPGAMHLQRAGVAADLAHAASAASTCAAPRHFLSFSGSNIRVLNQRDAIGMEYLRMYRERRTSPKSNPARLWPLTGAGSRHTHGPRRTHACAAAPP